MTILSRLTGSGQHQDPDRTSADGVAAVFTVMNSSLRQKSALGLSTQYVSSGAVAVQGHGCLCRRHMGGGGSEESPQRSAEASPAVDDDALAGDEARSG